MSQIADLIRELMAERGWNATDLSRRLEAVRPERFSESWRVQIDRWLKRGHVPTQEHAEALADAFEVQWTLFRPAQITQAELDELLAELAALRRREAETQQQNRELRQQLERLERASRRPQELLKPNSQRQASGK